MPTLVEKIEKEFQRVQSKADKQLARMADDNGLSIQKLRAIEAIISTYNAVFSGANLNKNHKPTLGDRFGKPMCDFYRRGRSDQHTQTFVQIEQEQKAISCFSAKVRAVLEKILEQRNIVSGKQEVLPTQATQEHYEFARQLIDSLSKRFVQNGKTKQAPFTDLTEQDLDRVMKAIEEELIRDRLRVECLNCIRGEMSLARTSLLASAHASGLSIPEPTQEQIQARYRKLLAQNGAAETLENLQAILTSLREISESLSTPSSTPKTSTFTKQAQAQTQTEQETWAETQVRHRAQLIAAISNRMQADPQISRLLENPQLRLERLVEVEFESNQYGNLLGNEEAVLEVLAEQVRQQQSLESSAQFGSNAQKVKLSK